MKNLVWLTSVLMLACFFVASESRQVNAQAVWQGGGGGGLEPDFWHVSNNWVAPNVPSNTTPAVFNTGISNFTATLNSDFNAQNTATALTFNGTSQYTLASFNVGAGTALLNLSGNVTNNASVNQTINVNTTFSGAAAKTISSTGAGQTIFNGVVTNTASGLTVSRTAAGATGSILFNGAVNATGQTLATNNSNTTGAVTFGGAVTAGSVSNIGSGVTNYGAITANSIANSGSGQVNVSGVVTSSGNPLTISKSGAGSIVFGNTVTATGSTITVNNVGASGTVAFNGAVTAGTVNVTGNRLEGTGTITASTNILANASYSAGQTGVANGVGTQTFNTGALSFADNSTFVWDLNNSAALGAGAPAGDVFDRVTANAGLSFGTTGFTTQINLTGAAPVVAGEFWDVFTSSTAITGNLLGSAISIANGAPNPNNVFFQWSLENGGLTGRITAVPEPSSMALLGMAGLIGGVYARRRAKKNKA